MRFYIIEYRVNGWGGEKDFMTDDSFFRSLDEAEHHLLKKDTDIMKMTNTLLEST
ncbi:hypothetical protein NRV55_000287 [Staphylococcus pseudintermedius]|nr:hypothetical protein [Staphylococcus pseudintermedius]EJN7321732.1 hypothetical protein [Staphylococcus pseudintermedius]